MKVTRSVIHQETVEIPDESFPIYLIKDHWAGLPTYYRIQQHRISVLSTSDVYGGEEFTFYTRELSQWESGIFDVHEVDLTNISDEECRYSNKVCRITEQEWNDALAHAMEVVLDKGKF